MRRIVYQPASASSGGGGAPTVGSLVVGPEYGEANKPALAAHVAMGAAGFAANRTVGAAIRLSAAEFSGGRSVGATVGFGGNFTNNRSVSAHIALPEAAFAANRDIGAAVRLSDAAFAAGRAASAHLGATYLGAPSWQSFTQTSGTVLEAETETDLPYPSGIAVGDLVIAFIAFSATGVISAPSGWTQINGTTNPNNNLRIFSFQRIIDGTEGASQTFTFPSGTPFAAQMHRIIAVDTTTPINVHAGGQANVVDPVVPSVTTTAINCMVFYAVSHLHVVSQSHSPPASNTEVSETTSGDTANIVTLNVGYRIFAATGSTGTATVDCNEITASQAVYQRIAVAPGTLVLQT